MQPFKLLLAPLVFFYFSATSYAAEVEVIWINPDGYSDIIGGVSERSHDAHVDKLFTTFEDYFSQLAHTLPEGEKLIVKIMDVDLAGQAWEGTQKRTIKNGTFPSMQLTYILKDQEGNVIKQNKASLKDLHFFNGSSRFTDRFLIYETRMIRKWFRKEFSEQLKA